MGLSRYRARLQALALATIGMATTLPVSTGPTGRRVVDLVLVGALTLFVALLGQHAPRLAIGAAAFATVGIASDVVLLGVVIAFALLGMYVPTRSRWAHLARGLSALGILNVLLRAEYDAHFGLSAAVGVLEVGLLTFRGLRIARRRHPQVVFTAVGAIVAILLVGLAGLFFSARGAEAHLRTGNREARAGLAALNTGDVDTARGHLQVALASMEEASRRLDSWSTQPSRLFPVVSQHRDALVEVITETTEALQLISADLELVDPELLRPTAGRFDLASITDLQVPMGRIVATLADLRAEVARHNSPWLIDTARRYLDDLIADIDTYAAKGQRTLEALEMAPPLLGADEPRSYFVAFVTPSEIRGSGGFMGNWAEFRVNNGLITMSRFGRTGELNSGSSSPRSVTGPSDWLSGYGPYGFTTNDGGSVESTVWSIVTLSPHFPSTAQVMAELYPQSGGRELDGVFALDVDVLSALLEFTGPIPVTERAEPLTVDNARQFLLLDQYAQFENPDRVDLIEEVAETAVDRLLDGSLPSPQVLGERLSPLAGEGRLLAWAARPDEQTFFQSLNLTGDIAQLSTTDTVVVSVNNGSANKIDYFLEGDIDYQLDISPTDGSATGTVSIDLRNTAPGSGLPDIVIGNRVDLPPGYNRLMVTALTRLPPDDVRVDGRSTPFTQRIEAGLHVIDVFVDIPPGGMRTITIDVSGSFGDSSEYSLSTRTPLTASVWTTNVRVNDTSGALVDEQRTKHGVQKWLSPSTD